MPITDQTEAEQEFNRLCPSSVCPELSDSEVFTILEANHRASLWAVSTLYELGAVVIPTMANRTGSRYRLIRYTDTATDQKSGTTEPAWTTSRDSEVTDNHVVWAEDGDDYSGVLWDIQEAARAGWLLKAAKTVSRVDFTTQSIGVNASQLHKHCLEMAARFQPFYCL